MNRATTAADNAPARPLWKRLLGLFLTIAAMAYLVHLAAADAQSFSDAFDKQDVFSLAGAGIAAIVMFALKAIYHAALCQRMSPKPGLFPAVLPAYATAQVIRYLPGKIWGVVYQSSRLSGFLHPAEVVAANTAQTIITNLLGAGIIASVLGAAHLRSPWPLLGIAVAIVVTELAHRKPWLEAWVVRFISKVLRRTPGELPSIPPLRITATLLLCLEWVAYYAIWAALLGDSMPLSATLIVATWYAAASLLAILAIAVPAGIAVREAIFVSLATMTVSGPAELLAYAALIRVVLTLAEIAFVPVANLSGKLFGRALEESA